ncbi:MAG: iron-sulfur cluster assembly scaffold protein [Mycoplasmataceae bacterium]|jgi:nitrogen fixation NifU-like protein|nr:iron-sulfur cluster assembly scaffold protein [Mycoplasmataceae bacterium]
MDNSQFKREIILEHYEKPSNKLLENQNIGEGFCSFHNASSSCIDNLTAHVKFSKNKIIDIKFDGVGCAISTSSTDIACELLKNKTKEQAKKIIENYFAMLNNQPYDEKLLGDLNLFNDVNKHLNRIKCAKIGIEAIYHLLNNQ